MKIPRFPLCIKPYYTTYTRLQKTPFLEIIFSFFPFVWAPFSCFFLFLFYFLMLRRY